LAKRIRLPKQVGRIRLPRRRRRSPVAAFLRSPVGQVIIAEALLALAGVLVAAATPATRMGRGLRAVVTEGARALHEGSSAMAATGTTRHRAAIVGSVVACGIAALRAVTARTGARSHGDADLTAEVKDVTPADGGTDNRPTSRSRIRRRARHVTTDENAAGT
jgi:hypothetical protein